MSKRMGDAFWAHHVEAARHSSVSGRVYADQHGISVKRLYFWQRKLRDADTSHASGHGAAKFVALRLPTPTSAGCVLTLAAGLRLEMSTLPAAEWLAALAKEMR
jgi:hypothetical protein